jgi:LacI family transcriptional regulator
VIVSRKETVSQQRIARDLGVSQALVSMVLNGKRENINPTSYRRIWDYALKIGYRPKGMQLEGNRGQITNVGFVLRAGVRLHTQTQFWSHVQHGLHAHLLEHGYHSLFLGSEDDLGVRSVQARLRQNPLFGLAVLGQVEEKFLKAIKAVQPNLVAISVSYPGLCHSVMPNEKQALGLLVDHLTELGHRRFAWLGGDRGFLYNTRRYAELIRAMDLHNLKLPDKFTINVEGGDRIEGWKAAQTLLAQISRRSFPTAWVCSNGLMARGVLNCLTQNGWRVPQEISVVTVDATRICEEEHPQITGAHSDPERIGTAAAELLLKQADASDEILSDVILPSRLTVRETSAKAVA